MLSTEKREGGWGAMPEYKKEMPDASSDDVYAKKARSNQQS
jgi:hypothetical protein